MTIQKESGMRQLPLFKSDKPKKVNILDRINEYNKDHCWQYDIRLKRQEKDLKESWYPREELLDLKVCDFSYERLTTDYEKRRAINFIKKHEWLGKISLYTTHWFGAYYKQELAGVILFAMPTAASKVVGEKTKDIERIISRGACVSWSPKNLASSFLMWCIKTMVNTTPYRVFCAYADPTAKELGTIYQACNFYYLGQTFGGNKKYINPYTGKLVTDRYFRARSAYKKYAQDLDIEWQDNWNTDSKMNWENIPDDIEQQLRDYSKQMLAESKEYVFPKKHKYYYVLGKTKKETKCLRKEFLNNNQTYPYPKERGSDYNDDENRSVGV